jgi:hypothetical protein
MNQFSAPASTTQPSIIAAKVDAFERLTFLGWRTGLTAIVAGLAASFFLFGYALIYWRNADMDLMIVYNALVLNDGRPQLFFDHTAYLTILSLKLWFRLLHALGLLDAYSLSAIPPASNAAAFDAAMTGAVRAGRVLAWLIATGCVLIFAALVRRIVRDWRIALMVLMVVGRSSSIARPLWMAVAAGLCILGLENKVQAILLIGVLPLLLLPFGSPKSASVALWRNPRSSWFAAGIAAVAAIASASAAWPLISVGFDRALLDAAHFHPLLLGRFGLYQPALLALIAACMIAYAAIWRVSAAETLASMCAVAAGASIALLALDVQYDANNVIAVLNPLEKMLTFADANTTDVANGSSLSGILLLLLDGVASVLARYSFGLHSSARPTVFLTWLIVPGIIVAWRRGEKLVAIQGFALLMAAIGIDALGVRRGLKSEYFIFTDPLIIIAGAILLDCLSDLRFRKWAYPLAVTLLGLHIAIGQAEPVKYAMKRSGPESTCQWRRYYLPLLPLPWCPGPPTRS